MTRAVTNRLYSNSRPSFDGYEPTWILTKQFYCASLVQSIAHLVTVKKNFPSPFDLTWISNFHPWTASSQISFEKQDKTSSRIKRWQDSSVPSSSEINLEETDLKKTQSILRFHSLACAKRIAERKHLISSPSGRTGIVHFTRVICSSSLSKSSSANCNGVISSRSKFKFSK